MNGGTFDSRSELKKAEHSFSPEEIDNAINLGRKIAGKAVITALINVIEEGPQRGLSQRTSDQLVKKAKQLITYDYSASVQFSFVETTYLLNLCLSIVPKDYKTEVSLPSEDYIRELFENYDFLKTTACAYWKQLSAEKPKLLSKIAAYRKDVDFSDLIVDPNNPTTMYFDPECEKRIGIFAYYVSADGVPFYKKI